VDYGLKNYDSMSAG